MHNFTPTYTHWCGCFFCSKCVKWATFSILQDFALTNAVALRTTWFYTTLVTIRHEWWKYRSIWDYEKGRSHLWVSFIFTGLKALILGVFFLNLYLVSKKKWWKIMMEYIYTHTTHTKVSSTKICALRDESWSSPTEPTYNISILTISTRYKGNEYKTP